MKANTTKLYTQAYFLFLLAGFVFVLVQLMKVGYMAQEMRHYWGHSAL